MFDLEENFFLLVSLHLFKKVISNKMNRINEKNQWNYSKEYFIRQ